MIAGIFDKLFKKKAKPPAEEEFESIPEAEFPHEFDDMGRDFDRPQFLDVPIDLDMEPNILYNFDTLEYKLKLHNKTNDILGDIDVLIKTGKNSVVKPVSSQHVVEMLEPGKSINMRFKLKPNYKLGKSSIYGKIEYFDFKSKERKIFRLPQTYIEFDFNKLQKERINEDKWRLICSGLKSLEIQTDTIETPPGEVFEVFKNTLNRFDLYMLPPIENVNLYRGIARFYGYNDENNQYAIESQVIGDKEKAKVLFRIWSDDPQSGMAIAFKTFDVVDKTIKIKEFIVET
jgi:hypothetical protein